MQLKTLKRLVGKFRISTIAAPENEAIKSVLCHLSVENKFFNQSDFADRLAIYVHIQSRSGVSAYFLHSNVFSLCSKQNMSSNSKGPMLCRLKVYSSRTSTLTMMGLFLRLGFHIEGQWYYMRFRLLWTVFKKMFLDFSIQVLSCSLKYSKSPGGHPRWINLKTLCKKELI